jgi:drug/metabolite transporter (DMT)-like permease
MASAAQMLAGGLLVFLIGLARGETITKPILPEAVLAWVYLVIFGSIVAYSAYIFLLKNTRPALATSYAYVNPIVAVGLGALLGGESISPARVAAMLVILLGVAFLTRARAKGS